MPNKQTIRYALKSAKGGKYKLYRLTITESVANGKPVTTVRKQLIKKGIGIREAQNIEFLIERGEYRYP